MTTDLVIRESWGGAAERGLQARTERQAIVDRVLIEGQDFGTIPGTDKKTLLKPGAEKITDALNLYPDYEPIETVEDWQKPLFHYRYRCRLRYRGTDDIIATGIGSCNSMENRYRWRKAERACPKCGQATVIKGKSEYGGGFLCFAKKGGCGEKFPEDDHRILSQPTGRIENDDVYSQVNTIDKMAQKRALVAANLNLGFSDRFTQDMEDLTPMTEEATPQPSVGKGPTFKDDAYRPPKAKIDKGPLPPKGPLNVPFIGALENHSQKSGKGLDDSPWTIHLFQDARGEEWSTYKADIADKLHAALGKKIELHWEWSGNYKRIIEFKVL